MSEAQYIQDQLERLYAVSMGQGSKPYDHTAAMAGAHIPEVGMDRGPLVAAWSKGLPSVYASLEAFVSATKPSGYEVARIYSEALFQNRVKVTKSGPLNGHTVPGHTG